MGKKLAQPANARAVGPRGRIDPEGRRHAGLRRKGRVLAGGLQGKDRDTARLAHDLQVHQIELEMQNEELREAHTRAEVLLAQYAELYECAPVGYLTLDREGTIQQVNLVGARLFGVERSRLVNRRLGLFVVEGDRCNLRDFLRAVFSSHATQRCELTLAHQDLQPVIVRVEGSRSADGQECRAVAVDITEPRRTEAAQRASRLLIEEIVNSLPARVFWKDENLKYLGCNVAFARDAGLVKPEDIIGKDDFQMVWCDQAESYRRDDRLVIESGCPRLAVEEPQTTPEGHIITLLTNKIPLRGPAGETCGVLGTYVDITDRKRAEEKTRELLAEVTDSRRVLLSVAEDQRRAEAELSKLNAELERRVLDRTTELSAANDELDSFAHSVSHDLRAPLRAMSGFSRALLEDYGEELPDEARGFLDRIIESSQNMGGLIDGLLALSRSTRGEIQCEQMDLSALAERVCLELASAEPAHLVQWDVEHGLTAWGDVRMLEVILTNLLGNAWKYTTRSAKPSVRLYAEREGELVWFCVADNGAGFDMRHADRLFKPFQRLHQQDEFPGIGIGLATVQRIVRRLGGVLSATATVGQGATFRFCLPSGSERGVDAS